MARRAGIIRTGSAFETRQESRSVQRAGRTPPQCAVQARTRVGNARGVWIRSAAACPLRRPRHAEGAALPQSYESARYYR
jgi:hypothetical protein